MDSSTQQHHSPHPYGGIRVLITEEDGFWAAQSLEIDYAAGGTSLDDVKERFINGLTRTMQVYMEQYQSIEKLIKPAPPEYWMAFMKLANKHQLNRSHVHMVEQENEYSSYINEIDFFQPHCSTDTCANTRK